jgi:hypothetical protein
MRGESFEPPNRLAPFASREKEAKTIVSRSVVAWRWRGRVTFQGRPLHAQIACAAA